MLHAGLRPGRAQSPAQRTLDAARRAIRSARGLAGPVAATATVLARPLPAGTAYDPASRRFALPGSAWPLALMMGIFCTKLAAGVALAQHPALARSAAIGWTVSALYGALSGIFLGRAARLWRLALPTLGAAPAIA